ncbi:MAG TPA: hypothetical protein VJV39_24480 [Dongiaceae bacterium]|nr:hypothetical protein [Dongiaceae bacterium]
MLRTKLSAALHFSIVATIALYATSAAGYSWERPHSVGSNSGFFDTTSIPATAPIKTIEQLDGLAAGAGPVIAADGTVIIGTAQGKLMAFHPDGTLWWSRDLPRQMIVASPTLDSEGSIYVIGIENYTDHRVSPPVKVQKSTLHKFTLGGGWLYQTPFPGNAANAITTAAPNIWKYNGTEAIMVPITDVIPNTGAYETRLIAFSTTGQVIGDVMVAYESPTLTGGPDLSWDDILDLLPPYGFTSQPVPERKFLWPQPTVALFTYAGGGTPFIIVASNLQDLVGYTFSNLTFQEVFRVHEDGDFRYFGSTPMVTPDGHTVVSTPAGIRFAGPNMNPLPVVKDVVTKTAPTQLASGKVAVVTNYNLMVILQGAKVENKIYLGSDASMASAAATRMHIFVSTNDALITYDANTFQEVARFNWAGGGLWQPVIGPQGNVYAIVGSRMYVFPGPGQANTTQTSTGSASTSPSSPSMPEPTNQGTGQPTQPAQSARHAYKPPLTADGNRLLACGNTDGDDCGKNDAKQIAQAFCEQQGFKSVNNIDTDTKKVQAQTLDGHACTKKKCKVFSKIVCASN